MANSRSIIIQPFFRRDRYQAPTGKWGVTSITHLDFPYNIGRRLVILPIADPVTISGQFYLVRQGQPGLPPLHGLTADHRRLIPRHGSLMQFHRLDSQCPCSKEQPGSDT
ncbi:MAG: hypothetical protein ACLUQN_10405 [Megasphaera sp.]|uniref:hypothetical protein n=1 Tax=unclassified Megasphaera TaxID=2626256 RepID=UPI00189980D2|nr:MULTISPECIES: hypothetical protein [unclassified Megasphaera]MDU3112118.1 hypothetical protein [Megasphaera sp.]MED9920505.1 hypothetical protein [Megasphaera sp.]